VGNKQYENILAEWPTEGYKTTYANKI